MPRRVKGLSHLWVDCSGFKLMAFQSVLRFQNVYFVFPGCFWPILWAGLSVKVLWSRQVKLTMCQRVNGWAEPAADRREQGGVLRLCLPCFHPSDCMFLLSEQHQRESRSTPEAPSPWVPCFLGSFRWKLFLVKLCHTLSCWRLQPAWNEAERPKDCGSGLGVNGHTWFVCLNPIRNGRYASSP